MAVSAAVPAGAENGLGLLCSWLLLLLLVVVELALVTLVPLVLLMLLRRWMRSLMLLRVVLTGDLGDERLTDKRRQTGRKNGRS